MFEFPLEEIYIWIKYEKLAPISINTPLWETILRYEIYNL